MMSSSSFPALDHARPPVRRARLPTGLGISSSYKMGFLPFVGQLALGAGLVVPGVPRRSV